jgi:hypothetical protein
MLGEFLQRQGELFNQKDLNQQIEEEITKGIPTQESRNNLFDQIKARRNDTDVIDDHNKELPQIDVSSASNSNESIEDILPEQVSQTGFNALFDQIRSKRNDTDVIGSPNISRVGLTPILEKVKGLFTPKSQTLDIQDNTKTLENKPSINNLFDDTNALFDDIDDNIVDNTTNTIDTNVDSNYVKNI